MFECEKCKNQRVLQIKAIIRVEEGKRYYIRSLRCMNCDHRFEVKDFLSLVRKEE